MTRLHRHAFAVALLVVALLPSGAMARGADRVSIGSDVNVPAGEEVHGDVVVIGGDATIDGRVLGDVMVLGGELALGPEARINGDLALWGGEITIDPRARVAGSVVGVSDAGLTAEHLVGRAGGRASSKGDGPLLELRPGADRTLTREIDLGRGGFIGSLGTSLLGCAFLMVLGLLFMSVWPERSRNLRRTLEASPWASLLMGWLVSMGLGLIALLLTISVVGLLALPFLASAALAVWLAGITGLLEAIGDRLPLPERLRSRGWDFIAGVALFGLLGVLWSTGGLLAGFAALATLMMGCMAVGASVLSGLGKTPYGT